jgi:hypothetical protein
MMHDTSMHDLMLGMFLGGMLLAAPPLLIGLALGAHILHQHRREKSRTNAPDSTIE